MRLTLATDVAATGQFGNIVLGVDTHKNTHTAAVLSEHGVLVSSSSFPTTAGGYARLLHWARGFGVLCRAGVEGTGSYGAGLARYLLQAEIEVIEVNQPDRASRRRRGKSDALDAESAARAVLGGYATAHAKSGDGSAEMLRVFKLAKDSAVKSRTQAINQLKAVIVNAPAELRDCLAGLGTHRLVQRCSALPSRGHHLEAATKHTLRLLARRIAHLDQEVADLTAKIRDTIAVRHAALLARYGAGPDTVATLLITVGDNPERMRSEASWKNHEETPQPRRRQTRQLGTLSNRALPHALGHGDKSLHASANQRREDQTRSDSLPQTLHRTRTLSTPRSNTCTPPDHDTDLTSIGASRPQLPRRGQDL